MEHMKDALVRVVRRYVPKGATRALEEVYRRSRVWALSARYGFPAKDMRVIAITGTNGKTTTAAYINEILKASGLKTAMFTTTTIEVAGERKANDLNVTVANTGRMQQFFKSAKEAGVDWVVLEVTSQALQQHKLDSVPIECAIMTNLTQDHLDYHKTMEEYAAAKGRLFARKPRFIVLNHDDEWFEYFCKFQPGEATMTYGTDPGAECRITGVRLHKHGSDVKLEIDHQTKLEVATLLPGKFNVYNMTAAVAAAYLLHVPLEDIQKGIANLSSVPGRQEVVPVKQPYEVIVDYAHTPDALKQLLETMKHLTKNRVILVFGACGDRDQSKRPMMGEIAAELADRIILTDEESYNEEPQAIRDMVREGIERKRGSAKTEEIADRRKAIEKALSIARPGDTVLITGMGHEQFRIVNGERLPWNDTEVVKEILA
jgi:UDP-N-acetylmuramoyl-L-alanyl-D-glutamate--2,6-diaminopimelate ligase